MNAPDEEEKKNSKAKPKPQKERVLTEEELKKREENKLRLENLRKKRELDAKRREEKAVDGEEKKVEQVRILEEMKAKPAARKNKMFKWSIMFYSVDTFRLDALKAALW